VNNSAAIGYMILAAKRLGFSEDQIRKLEATMKSEMDFITEDQAEEAYRSF